MSFRAICAVEDAPVDSEPSGELTFTAKTELVMKNAQTTTILKTRNNIPLFITHPPSFTNIIIYNPNKSSIYIINQFPPWLYSQLYLPEYC